MRPLTILLICITIISCKSIKNIDISKYPMVVTANELMEHYELDLDTSGTHEVKKITKYFDGSVELEYSYDFLETKEYNPLYYAITINKERNIHDASLTYGISGAAVQLALNSGKQGKIKIEYLDLPGDKNYYAIRTYDDSPMGHYYTMRKGTVVYTMFISGLYSEDHSILLDLILPRIEDLETFQIVKDWNTVSELSSFILV